MRFKKQTNQKQYRIESHGILDDNMYLYRSSSPEVLCKKDVVKNFVKFIGKHLCLSLFFNKVAGLSLQLY